MSEILSARFPARLAAQAHRASRGTGRTVSMSVPVPPVTTTGPGTATVQPAPHDRVPVTSTTTGGAR